MIGLDTNIVIRLLVDDNEGQCRRAKAFVGEQAERGAPPLINHLVLLETEWVLRSRYNFSRPELSHAILSLLELPDVAVEQPSVVIAALYTWDEHGGEFADSLIAARNFALGCTKTMTFDRRAVRLPGFDSL